MKLFCYLLLSVAVSAVYVDPSLHRALRTDSNVNLILTMKGGIESAINHNKLQIFSTRTDRLDSFRKQLMKNAESSQSPVIKILSQKAAAIFLTEIPTFESIWISNSMYIQNASADLVEQLMNVSEIAEIRQEKIIQLEPTEIINRNVTSTTENTIEWGVSRIRADEVWKKGNTGQGIIVGAIDTGVHGTHTTLKDSYIGNKKHGWYDPISRSTAPLDDHGHGTHTMGTIVGSGGIGVAPGAKWLACRGCSKDGCSESNLLKCGQFMLCPTDTNNRNSDCSLAPHIVSNSWGGPQGDPFYAAVVRAWRAAGIIPVFANGNAGPSCETSASPADYNNVIAVGSTTYSGTISDFSSLGPSYFGLMKPDIVAPGSYIQSAATQDTTYATMSGTSMAAPHVSGSIALMLSHLPDLSYDEIYKALTSTSYRTLSSNFDRRCGGISDSVFPNNVFGYGLINSENAILGPDSDSDPTDPQPPSLENRCDWDWWSQESVQCAALKSSN